MNAILIKNLSLILEKKTYNLENINLKIKKGQTYAILGGDNNGKSILLSIIGGLRKSDQGEIYFFDKDIHNINLDTYRTEMIGHIFSHNTLIRNATVAENLEIVSEINNKKITKLAIQNTLKLVNLGEEYVEKTIADLSFYEKQLVTLARCLIKDIEMIVAINPTNNFSYTEVQNYMEILLKVCKDNNITLLISTNSNYVCKDIDHIYGMNKGRLNFIK